MITCSFCLYIPPADDDEVAAREGALVTVINGQAVCVDHAGLAQGGDHSRLLALAVKQAGYESLSRLQAARLDGQGPA